jgi:hypothetical protein
MIKLKNKDVRKIYINGKSVLSVYVQGQKVWSADSVPGNFEFGVSGHPSSQGNYRNRPAVNYPYQVQVLQDIGAKWYRLDQSAQPNGEYSNNPDGYFWGRIFGTSPADIGFSESSTSPNKENYGIYWKCQAADIKVLPMLSVRSKDNSGDLDWVVKYPTPQDAYDYAYNYAARWATAYGQYFTHLELGNELELFTNLIITRADNSKPPGTQAAHYYPDKLERAVRFIKGMEEGAKSVKPDLITMFGTAGWLAVYLLDQVLAAAPSIDKIVWHWYSNMQTNIKNSDIGKRLPGDGKTPYAGNFTNIFDYIANRYPGKKVWFTEFGYRWKGDFTWEQHMQRQLDNYLSFMADANQATNVEAILYHELLDMISAGTVSDESYYGLVGYPDFANTGPANPERKLLTLYLADQQEQQSAAINTNQD